MSTSTQTIAVTFCCSEEDLARVRPLATTLEHEALEVHICAGVDLDARALERHMAKPRSPGAFVMCESLDLDAYQLPELEARFEQHKGELDQFVRVNLERESAEQMLDRIRAFVAKLAGEEQTLEPGAAKRADISDAIALAKRLVEENARTAAYARVAAADQGPAAAPAPEPEPKAAAKPEPEPEPKAAPEPEPEPTNQPQPTAANQPAAKRGGLGMVAAVLALAIVAGGAWFAWDSGLFGPSESSAEPSPTTEASPAAAAPAQAAEPAQPTAQPGPDGDVVLANANELAAADTDGEGEDQDPELDAEQPEEDEEDDEAAELEAEAEAPEDTRIPPKLGAIRKLDELLVAPVADTELLWRDASNHCRLHKRDGKLGWRLASIKQLKQLEKAGMLEPGASYWSTTLAIVGGTKNLVLDAGETRTHGEEKTEFRALAQCVYKPK